jgi:SAM-dependent methyltransferase
VSNSSRESWSAFSPSLASRYLKTYGAPSGASRDLVVDVLKKLHAAELRVLDLGCGNGQLYDHFKARHLRCRYTGVDFSDALLTAARENHDGDRDVRFLADDVEVLGSLDEEFDVVVYSHVIEMLESPESSLLRARELAPTIVIRFFEPPADTPDTTELRWMEVVDDRTVPYLRRTLSLDYYRLILARIECHLVEIYHDPSGAKDQVHVLSMR